MKNPKKFITLRLRVFMDLSAIADLGFSSCSDLFRNLKFVF